MSALQENNEFGDMLNMALFLCDDYSSAFDAMLSLLGKNTKSDVLTLNMRDHNAKLAQLCEGSEARAKDR